MRKVHMMEIHGEACDTLIDGVLNEGRLQRIEAQKAESLFGGATSTSTSAADSSSAGGPEDPNHTHTALLAVPPAGDTGNEHATSSLDVVATLAFGGGDVELPLLYPLRLSGTTAGPIVQRYHTTRDEACSCDIFRSKVRQTDRQTDWRTD